MIKIWKLNLITKSKFVLLFNFCIIENCILLFSRSKLSNSNIQSDTYIKINVSVWHQIHILSSNIECVGVV